MGFDVGTLIIQKKYHLPDTGIVIQCVEEIFRNGRAVYLNILLYINQQIIFHVTEHTGVYLLLTGNDIF